MKNFTFMLWSVLWPISCDISNYLYFLEGNVSSKNIETIVAISCVIIWVCIGKLLYEKTN